MGIAEHSIVALRIFGDDLVPAEVTRLLGSEPTASYAKGDTRVGSKTGKRYIEKTGSWRLSAEDRRPEDIPAQVTEILSKLSHDLEVWGQLNSRYDLDFFCGVFMGSSNDALEFSPEMMRQLADRGIKLVLDVYHHTDE